MLAVWPLNNTHLALFQNSPLIILENIFRSVAKEMYKFNFYYKNVSEKKKKT